MSNYPYFCNMERPVVQFEWVRGLSYSDVWEKQTMLQQSLIRQKVTRHRAEESGETLTPLQYLLFCEHKPVYTLGKSGSEQHILLTESEIEAKGIEFFRINRGGDITYHGPGQITGYPILDLEFFFTDVHRYVRYLEEAVIRVLQRFGLEGIRIKEYTGVWLPPDAGHAQFRKICAIGVHLSRWVTMHGFAFNVNTDTSWFQSIVPCGIQDADKTVTSMAAETGRQHSMEEIGALLLDELAALFGFVVIEKPIKITL